MNYYIYETDDSEYLKKEYINQIVESNIYTHDFRNYVQSHPEKIRIEKHWNASSIINLLSIEVKVKYKCSYDYVTGGHFDKELNFHLDKGTSRYTSEKIVHLHDHWDKPLTLFHGNEVPSLISNNATKVCELPTDVIDLFNKHSNVEAFVKNNLNSLKSNIQEALSSGETLSKILSCGNIRTKETNIYFWPTYDVLIEYNGRIYGNRNILGKNINCDQHSGEIEQLLNKWRNIISTINEFAEHLPLFSVIIFAIGSIFFAVVDIIFVNRQFLSAFFIIILGAVLGLIFIGLDFLVYSLSFLPSYPNKNYNQLLYEHKKTTFLAGILTGLLYIIQSILFLGVTIFLIYDMTQGCDLLLRLFELK